MDRSHSTGKGAWIGMATGVVVAAVVGVVGAIIADEGPPRERAIFSALALGVALGVVGTACGAIASVLLGAPPREPLDPDNPYSPAE
jgi:drug/metabolite transporter (DMT)-like permease